MNVTQRLMLHVQYVLQLVHPNSLARTNLNETLLHGSQHSSFQEREAHLVVTYYRNSFSSHNGSICIQSIGFIAFNWEKRMWSHMHVCTIYVHFVYLCVRVSTPQRPRGGVKPLRAVYTNTPTKDTSCCQSGREIYLPDSLEHLGLFKRKQAADSRQSGTQNCCHIAG